MKKPILTLVGSLLALSGLSEAQTTIRAVYGTTTGVRNSVGGTNNTNSLLNTKFSGLRSSDSNSNTGVRWTRSSHFSATYNNQNQTAATQLTRLRTGGQLSGFRNFRNNSNADLAQLFCDWTNGGILGLANQPGWPSICRRNVLSVNSGNGPTRWTHVHETGHSMNASHGHGFCINGLSQRTLMEPNGSSCNAFRRVNYFSARTRSKNNRRLGNNSNQNRERIRSRRRAASRLQ